MFYRCPYCGGWTRAHYGYGGYHSYGGYGGYGGYGALGLGLGLGYLMGGTAGYGL